MGKRTISRRQFLEGSGTALTVVAGAPALRAQRPATPPAPATSITLTVNGTARRLDVEDRWTLVEALRDHARLDRHEDRVRPRRMRRLHGPARRQAGLLVQLSRGLGGRPLRADRRRPRRTTRSQQAFIDHDAPQCGFCTSGQLMSAKALLNANPRPTADEARAAMTGNICRCSNYSHYVDATVAASRQRSARNGRGPERTALHTQRKTPLRVPRVLR